MDPARLLACALLSLSLLAQTPSETKPQKLPASEAQAKTPAHALTAQDVEAFLDGLMPLELQRSDVAGAVVTIVKDGHVLFAKGYGYADVKTKKPVTPDTLFRPGSISKLFTWTAVMQQVEQGKLDLDRDVNEYLDFKIPATFPQPITLRHIMTHTAGFSETAKDMWVDDPKHFVGLRTYLVRHMPARLYPPGTTPAYSNYATTLAGYIVQRVSGESFDDYTEHHIFQPLGMTHTSFRQPVPAQIKEFLSSGYKEASSDPKAFENVELEPAGSSSISANDAAKFMIAHLQDGTGENGVHILKAQTAQLMHTRQALPAGAALNAMCLGFYEETRNGHRIYGHGGDTEWFHSDLHLVPDAHLGFFVSYNSAGNGKIHGLRGPLWQEFLDRYLPYEVPNPPTLASAAADAKKVAGEYITSRREGGNWLNVSGMASANKITANSDGTISAGDFKGRNDVALKFREIAPNLWQRVDGQEKLAFYSGYDGRTTFGIDFPAQVYQRATLLESQAFNAAVVIGALVIMAFAVILWPVAAMARRHYGAELVFTQRERRWRLFTKLVCALDLAFVLGLLFFITKLDDIAALNDAMDKWIRLLQFIGVLGVLGSTVAVVNAVSAWRGTAAVQTLAAHPGGTAASSSSRSVTKRWIWDRLSQTAVAIACLGFAWFLLYWNFLDFRLNY